MGVVKYFNNKSNHGKKVLLTKLKVDYTKLDISRFDRLPFTVKELVIHDYLMRKKR